MDNHIHRRSDLLPDGLQRQAGGSLEHHGLQAAEHVVGGVGVSGGQGAVMPRVHGLEHVQRLLAAHLPHDI